jgi:hypothetical protein
VSGPALITGRAHASVRDHDGSRLAPPPRGGENEERLEARALLSVLPNVMEGGTAMATAVRTHKTTWSAPLELDEMLEVLSRDRHDELEARSGDANEIDALSDSCWGAGIGIDMLDITDSTESIVLSISGRDRRLRIR